MLQPTDILLQKLAVPECVSEKLEQPAPNSLPRLSQAIEDAEAMAAVKHEAGVLEVGQMTGNIGLRGGQDILNVATAEFAVDQQIHDTKTVGIRQAPETRYEFLHITYIRIHA